jgi:exonuclease SbcD
MLRILHTADWHLGKLLGDLSRETEHTHFLAFLLDCILAENIDVLVIAGDVFDSANPPQSAVAQYYQFLSELHTRSQCQVVTIAGNHDSPAHLEAPKPLLNLLRTHVIGHLPEDLRDALIPIPSAENPQLILAAIPFLRDKDLRSGQSGQSPADIQAALNQSITEIYQQAASKAREIFPPNIPLIALGHLTVAGSHSSDSEREIHIGGLGALPADNFPADFSYVALGHLHRPQTCGSHETIRYSGSPIPLSFSESTDRKKLRLLELEDDFTLNQRSIEIPLTRKLIQVKSDSAGIEQKLLQLSSTIANEKPMFTPWVEVLLSDHVPGDVITNRIQQLCLDAPFSIIRVMQQRSGIGSSIERAESTVEADMDERLSNPTDLFQLRLTQETALTDEQREKLTTAFQQLLTLQRGE